MLLDHITEMQIIRPVVVTVVSADLAELRYRIFAFHQVTRMAGFGIVYA